MSASAGLAPALGGDVYDEPVMISPAPPASPKPFGPDKKVPRFSRADEVYQQLKSDVSDFKLVPGDRFTETEISDRLGVSRTPVRQALFRLQQEGFVEVLFRSGWRVLPFDFDQFEELYDLRMVLETTAARRLCSSAPTLDASQSALPLEGAGAPWGGPAPRRTDKGVNRKLLDDLAAIWLVAPGQRSSDTVQVAQWDEAFHCALVAAAGNAEMARVHSDVTDRIRVIRRLDFTKQPRIDATYEEHAKILQAIQHQRGDQAALLLRSHIQTSQAEVRKITLHQMHLARQAGGAAVG